MKPIIPRNPSATGLITLAVLLAWSPAPTAPQKEQGVWRIILPAKVRDFKGYDDQKGHPDFQNYLYLHEGPENDVKTGTVERTISKTGKSSSFKMDNRNPKMAQSSEYYTGPEFFNDWYNDRDPDVNRPFLIGLEFEVSQNCKLTYHNARFFPLDQGEEFYSLNSPPLRTFDAEATFPRPHNFSFTMEFHTKFTYIKGAGQRFYFSGDDDVWVFINDSLVIDLGGIHAPKSQTVWLDRLRPGFLEDGEEYILDFFSAERYAAGSQIIIETSILMDVKLDPGIFVKRQRTTGKVMKCYGQKVRLPDPKPISGMAPTIRPMSFFPKTGFRRMGNCIRLHVRHSGPTLPFRVFAANGQCVDRGNLSLKTTAGHGFAGRYTIPNRLPSGVYFFRVQANGSPGAHQFVVME